MNLEIEPLAVSPAGKTRPQEAAPLSNHLLVPPELVPNLDELVIEDGEPLDSIFMERQERLLTEPLYASWHGPGDGRPFQAFANVGLFYHSKRPALAPDIMLAVDVECGDLTVRANQSYFIWERGKPPDVVIEMVSNRRGREEDFKWDQYARIGVPCYVIFDPWDKLHHGLVRGFANNVGSYLPVTDLWFPPVGLGLTLWTGEYQGNVAQWLRWCDRSGQLLPTGQESAEQEKQRAEQEKQRAEQAGQELHQERRTKERLEAKLRELGIDPKSV